METHSPAVEPWAFAVMLIGLPICFFLFFKSFRAQTRKAYWSYNGIIAAVMLVMFGLLTTAGLIPSTEHLRQQQAEAPPPQEFLSNLPTSYFVISVWSQQSGSAAATGSSFGRIARPGARGGILSIPSIRRFGTWMASRGYN